MSSLAATRADGFYYDPLRFDPNRKGRDSVNALAGSHHLGVRAKRLHTEGILVVRFEMPHDVWCDGCGRHVARGVRFNADKKKAGEYYTTTIWEFRMKCPSCDTEFVIRTDPKNSDYAFVSGCRKKVREYSAASAEAIELKDERTAAALASDPFFRLEHASADAARARAASARLASAMQTQSRRYEDDYAANQAARQAARAGRRLSAAALAEGAAIGLAIPLLPATAADELAAAEAIASREEKEARSVLASAPQPHAAAPGAALVGNHRYSSTTAAGRQSSRVLPRAHAAAVLTSDIFAAAPGGGNKQPASMASTAVIVRSSHGSLRSHGHSGCRASSSSRRADEGSAASLPAIPVACKVVQTGALLPSSSALHRSADDSARATSSFPTPGSMAASCLPITQAASHPTSQAAGHARSDLKAVKRAAETHSAAAKRVRLHIDPRNLRAQEGAVLPAPGVPTVSRPTLLTAALASSRAKNG